MWNNTENKQADKCEKQGEKSNSWPNGFDEAPNFIHLVRGFSPLAIDLLIGNYVNFKECLKKNTRKRMHLDDCVMHWFIQEWRDW